MKKRIGGGLFGGGVGLGVGWEMVCGLKPRHRTGHFQCDITDLTARDVIHDAWQ